MMNQIDFDEVYRQHWEKLYIFCHRLTNDEDLAKNIVQDIFTDLWLRRQHVQILSVGNYLFGAAKKQILKTYRKKRFDIRAMEDRFENYLVDTIDEADEAAIEKLYQLLETLPAKRKEILILHKLEQLKVDEIAARLNLSPQTVKNQLSSALKQLKIQATELSVIFFPAGILLLLSLTI